MTSGKSRRESDALYRRVVEGSLQGIIIQQDGRIVYANPAMARLFGYDSPADLIGLSPFEDLIFEGDLQMFRERTAAVQAGAEVAPLPGWRARHRHGAELWLSSTAQSTRWRGRPAVASFYFDVTQRELAERARRESEALYRSALIAGRMGAWETDLVARTRTWTAEGMALFGINLPDGRGQVGGATDEYLAAIHPDDRHLVGTFYALADAQDSFDAEYRVVRADGTTLWLSGRGQVLSRTSSGRAHRLVSIMTDVTRRKAAELHIGLLVREITHRSKNMLAVVLSIARQTARSAETVGDFEERFAQRLQALAASNDVLVSEEWRRAPLQALVQQQLLPFDDAVRPRLDFSGPAVALNPEAAQAVGLAIHELATNAMKHGALSIPAGRVMLRWHFDGEPGGSAALILKWMERDGPAVAAPARKGFGHFVLSRLIASTLGTDARLDFPSHGFEWMVAIPRRYLQPLGDDAPSGRVRRRAPRKRAAEGATRDPS
jgi:PAS domain S-box-containing protein